MSYQRPDRAFIDYNVYEWGRLNQSYRGPRPDLSGEYVACLGAAQTFGRYVEAPFPALLQKQLGLPVANFGTSSAGPGFFLRDSTVLEAASDAAACVIQVMSARSISNRLFKVQHQRNAQIKAVSQALEDLFPRVDFETFTLAHNMLNQIEENDPQRFVEVEMELKTAWVARTRLLLESIHTKKILFWFSERSPEAEPRIEDGREVLLYPQYVDRGMIDAVSPYVDEVVFCTSAAGMPQSLLVNGEAVLRTPYGLPVAENRYYPSPEMHQDAADALCAPVADLIASDQPSAARSDGITV